MILVVGAGLTGCVIARELANRGRDVLVVDRRSHVAGNAYDHTDEYGFRIHSYGPHLFHTKNRRVWDYLAEFAEWVPYRHRVRALLPDGSTTPFPPNSDTLFDCECLGLDVLETFYRPYTEKMWGRPLEEVNPKILDRVPLRHSEEEDYFPDDPYQGLPLMGYTEMCHRILDHPKIRVRLGVSHDWWSVLDFEHTFSSAPIDEHYRFVHGPLEWRSIKFHTYRLPIPRALDAPTVNFTHRGPHTRVTEWKQLPMHGDHPFMTALTFEEPCDYRDNDHERYYPVDTPDNRERHRLYKEIKDPKVTHVGRCGSFAYIDMDQAVNQALQKAEKYLGNP
jgi:UDP-galactopyranose mutase